MAAIKFCLTSSTFYTKLVYHFKFNLNRSKRFRNAEFHEKIFRYRDLRTPPILHSQSSADRRVVYNFKV